VRRRSLRNRLALIFGLIVLGAIAVVYLSVVPQLEGALREQKLDSLAEAAEGPTAYVQRRLGSDPARLVQVAADRSGARVTLLDISTGTQGSPLLSPSADSAPAADPGDALFAIAQEAALTGRVTRGTEPTSRGRLAEVAVPLRSGGRAAKVLVFSDDLEDVVSNVAYVRRQLLVSGGAALVIAVLAGYLVALALSRRVERLESAARKVASGDFSTRVDTRADDELGQLARTFDAMQTQLASLDLARKRFIATASHELRTPVFSLGGFLELLADEELDDETRQAFIAQVREQAARLGKLTTELLDLSRLEAGALELRPEPTDLAALAHEVTSEFTPAIQRHGAHVDVDVRGEPLEVECDPERVAQVLRILMDNALVHTPPGTGIRVTAARENGEVRLAVSDTGHGITRHTMPHIFEPFFTSNDDAQGAGLGLTIASELAERMRGRLLAESAPGSTTFTLVLPT
jgi:two-component system, OmpR family, sensor kinase